MDEYLEFISQCKNKKYELTHKHHIIPIFMGGDNSDENIIHIGYIDHQLAHIKLAECFDNNSKEYKYNMLSAVKLSGWAESVGDEMLIFLRDEKLGKTYEEMYGYEKSIEIKKKISDVHKNLWKTNEYRNKMCLKFKNSNHLRGKTYEDVYGKNRSEVLKGIRSENSKNYWNNLSYENKNNAISLLHDGYRNWYKNLTTEDLMVMSEKTSIQFKEWWGNPDNIHKIKERNKKISIALMGRTVTWGNKISKNHHDVSGKNNPMYGKTHSDKTKKLISDAAKNRNYENYKHPRIKYNVYEDGILIDSLYGQNECKQYAKDNNLNFKELFKGELTYKNYKCKKTKL